MSLQSAAQAVLGPTDEMPQTMEVESSVLEPLNISDNTARFVLENVGILSKDSVLQFQLTVPTAQSGKAFLPVGAGIYGLIKSAVLRVGARRICDINSLGFYKSMTHSYDTPSYRTNRTRILKGINSTLLPTPVGPTDKNAGKFIPAGSQLEYENQANLPADIALTDSHLTTPCWSLFLRDLFPILNSIELPLFLLKDEIAIDLVFNTQLAADVAANGVGTLCCFSPPALATCSLYKPSCRLFLDTILYSNERMELIQQSVNAQQGMSLPYTDVIQNVASIPRLSVRANANDVVNSGPVINQVPISGFRAKNILWAYTLPDRATHITSGTAIPPPAERFYNPLLGKYALTAYHKDATWDMRVNDRLIFPQPVTSATIKAAEAETVYGSPVWLNQALWSYNAVSEKEGRYATTAPLCPDLSFNLWSDGDLNAEELQGQLSFNAVNLSNGWGDDDDDFTLIQEKPVEVLHNDLPTAPEDNCVRTVYYFCEVVKYFSVKGGAVDIQQGPAVMMPVAA